MFSTFNLILAFMTLIDTFYLITSIIEYSLVEAFRLTSTTYDRVFVYFLYPIHNITLVTSVFLHIVMAFERYLAVCHPQMVYAQPRRIPVNGMNRNGSARYANKCSGQYSTVILKKVRLYTVWIQSTSYLCDERIFAGWQLTLNKIFLKNVIEKFAALTFTLLLVACG